MGVSKLVLDFRVLLERFFDDPPLLSSVLDNPIVLLKKSEEGLIFSFLPACPELDGKDYECDEEASGRGPARQRFRTHSPPLKISDEASGTIERIVYISVKPCSARPQRPAAVFFSAARRLA